MLMILNQLMKDWFLNGDYFVPVGCVNKKTGKEYLQANTFITHMKCLSVELDKYNIKVNLCNDLDFVRGVWRVSEGAFW